MTRHPSTTSRLGRKFVLYDKRVEPMAAALWNTERHFARKRGIDLPRWHELERDAGNPFVLEAIDIIKRREPDARLIMYV